MHFETCARAEQEGVGTSPCKVALPRTTTAHPTTNKRIGALTWHPPMDCPGTTGFEASKCAIPIRWMAPEVLRDSICSAATERWSFAVLLWEVFSLGARPYPSVENREVLPYVLSGRRLEMLNICRHAALRQYTRSC